MEGGEKWLDASLRVVVKNNRFIRRLGISYTLLKLLLPFVKDVALLFDRLESDKFKGLGEKEPVRMVFINEVWVFHTFAIEKKLQAKVQDRFVNDYKMSKKNFVKLFKFKTNADVEKEI